MKIRVSGFAITLAAVLLTIPVLVLAQSTMTPIVQPDWPVGGTNAPYYRKGEVAGVTEDAQGNVYMVQPTRMPVLVFDRNGNYLRGWGNGELIEPHSVRIDRDGNVWIPDIRLHQVKKFSPNGVLLQTFGTKKKKGRVQATKLNGPTDVAFGTNGDVYITDGYGNSRVIHLSRNGTYLGEWGSHGSDPGEFRLPHSIAVDAQGLIYVADRGNARIQVFTPDGTFVRQWDTVDTPWGLSITADGKIFMGTGYPYTVAVYNLQGDLLAYWGHKVKGRPVGAFAQVHMLCADSQGNLYTAELAGHRVQKFSIR